MFGISQSLGKNLKATNTVIDILLVLWAGTCGPLSALPSFSKACKSEYLLFPDHFVFIIAVFGGHRWAPCQLHTRSNHPAWITTNRKTARKKKWKCNQLNCLLNLFNQNQSGSQPVTAMPFREKKPKKTTLYLKAVHRCCSCETSCG